MPIVILKCRNRYTLTQNTAQYFETNEKRNIHTEIASVELTKIVCDIFERLCRMRTTTLVRVYLLCFVYTTIILWRMFTRRVNKSKIRWTDSRLLGCLLGYCYVCCLCVQLKKKLIQFISEEIWATHCCYVAKKKKIYKKGINSSCKFDLCIAHRLNFK